MCSRSCRTRKVISAKLLEEVRTAERLEQAGDSNAGAEDKTPETILIGYGRVGCATGSPRCTFPMPERG